MRGEKPTCSWVRAAIFNQDYEYLKYVTINLPKVPPSVLVGRPCSHQRLFDFIAWGFKETQSVSK